MSATAATAMFSVAYLSLPMKPEMASSHGGSRFDWTTLSTTTLIGHGWSTSASVSPTTAMMASDSVFQWGRTSAVMRSAVRAAEEDALGSPLPMGCLTIGDNRLVEDDTLCPTWN